MGCQLGKRQVVYGKSAHFQSVSFDRTATGKYNWQVMLDRLPGQVEPLGLTEAGRSFRGDIIVSGLSRLADYLADTTGQIAVELSFRIDERQVRAVTGRLQVNLELICQRCLGSMNFPLNLKFQLGVVCSEDEAGALPGEYEPLLVDGEPIALKQIIEDEIILALPVIPKHPDSTLCQGSAQPHKPERRKASPFSVLKQLNTK